MQASNRPARGAATSAPSPAAASSAPSTARAQLALVRAAGAPVEVGVAEALVLHVGDQAALVELRRARPRCSQARSRRARRRARGRRRAGRPGARRPRAAAAGPSSARAPGPGARALAVARPQPQRARGQRDRRVRPLRGAALLAAGAHAPGAHVREELGGRRRARAPRVKVRPMSTPAWSSLPPMPMPSRVATYVAAGRFSSRARAPLRISQIANSSARRRRWRRCSGAATV